MEERSRLNKQSSPAAQAKLGGTASDPALQSHSEPVSLGSSPAAQTPPMQRPVEPQEGQHKVGHGGGLSV